MIRKICSVFGAGEYFGSEKPVDDSYIVAADGGINYFADKDYNPDIVIGDFDSGECPDYLKTIRLNPIKDETDMYQAVRLGLAEECSEFHIFGGTGGRTAHTLANIQLLHFLAKLGKKAYLYGNKEIFTVLYNSSIKFTKDSEGYISVFSLDEESKGVTETGLKYKMNNGTMQNSYTIGISNEFIGLESEISVADGSLLIVYPFTAEEII